MAQDTGNRHSENSSWTKQNIPSSFCRFLTQPSQRATSGIGSVLLLAVVFIGIAGSAVGYKLATDAGFGAGVSLILACGGFVSAIFLIVFLQCLFIFLIEYVAVAIGSAMYTVISRVSKRIFTERTRTILGRASLIIVIPCTIVLMLNALLMGIPSLFFAVYAAEAMFEWGVTAGAGTTLSTGFAVLTATIIIVGSLTPITLMDRGY